MIDFKLPYNLKLGDKVKILKLTNDSGNATDLFGVEAHLNAWISNYYFEEIEGTVEFNKDKLMVVVRSKYTELPLSPDIRYTLFCNDFENEITKSDLDELKEEFDLKDTTLDAIIDYVKII